MRETQYLLWGHGMEGPRKGQYTETALWVQETGSTSENRAWHREHMDGRERHGRNQNRRRECSNFSVSR